jgi:hypothetical protein
MRQRMSEDRLHLRAQRGVESVCLLVPRPRRPPKEGRSRPATLSYNGRDESASDAVPPPRGNDVEIVEVESARRVTRFISTCKQGITDDCLIEFGNDDADEALWPEAITQKRRNDVAASGITLLAIQGANETRNRRRITATRAAHPHDARCFLWALALWRHLDRGDRRHGRSNRAAQA